MQRSAFFPARNYLLKGLSLLPPSPHMRWKQHYFLALSLSVKLAGIECSLGRFVDCERLVQEIKLHALKPQDKLAALFAQIEAYGSQGRIDDAIEVCRGILHQWGEPLFQAKKFTKTHVTTELGKTKWLLKGKDDAYHLHLPRMTNPSVNVIHKVYCKLSHLARWAHHYELLQIVSLRVMRLTVQYGLNEASSHAFGLCLEYAGSRRLCRPIRTTGPRTNGHPS